MLTDRNHTDRDEMKAPLGSIIEPMEIVFNARWSLGWLGPQDAPADQRYTLLTLEHPRHGALHFAIMNPGALATLISQLLAGEEVAIQREKMQ
jgi:hypothetical protein